MVNLGGDHCEKQDGGFHKCATALASRIAGGAVYVKCAQLATCPSEFLNRGPEGGTHSPMWDDSAPPENCGRR